MDKRQEIIEKLKVLEEYLINNFSTDPDNYASTQAHIETEIMDVRLNLEQELSTNKDTDKIKQIKKLLDEYYIDKHGDTAETLDCINDICCKESE